MGAENNADPRSGVDIFASSASSEIIDVKQVTSDCLPKFVATTLGGCLLMVGIMFSSVMVAVRSVVSIAFTLATVYAVAIGIYQYGWLSDSGPVGNTGGIFFMVPFTTFTTVVGLALDYDIFLVSCIADMRAAGLPNKLAVEEGLAQTGYVITMAGIIMFIAFGGLLLSSVPCLNQVSWIFASAVILDTFVVRTVVTPALMAALGEANWWPLEYPIYEAAPQVGGEELGEAHVDKDSLDEDPDLSPWMFIRFGCGKRRKLDVRQQKPSTDPAVSATPPAPAPSAGCVTS